MMLHATQYLYILINKRTLKKCNALYQLYSAICQTTTSVAFPQPFLLFCIPAFHSSIPQASHSILALFSSFRICTILSLYYVPIQTANSWTAGQVRSIDLRTVIPSFLIPPGIILLIINNNNFFQSIARIDATTIINNNHQQQNTTTIDVMQQEYISTDLVKK